jgi:hypothetical protein
MSEASYGDEENLTESDFDDIGFGSLSHSIVHGVEVGPGGLIRKEGQLEKMSPSFFQGYQKRWFVLEDKKLTYYK